jgi:hypothetical protein
LLYYGANSSSAATPPPRPGGGGWRARVVFVRRHEDLFTARRAGTARKGGRASMGGLKVWSVWGGRIARTEQLRAQYTAG